MSGIFKGNTLGSRSMGFTTSLEGVTIPWQLWDKPGFKDKHAWCWQTANDAVQQVTSRSGILSDPMVWKNHPCYNLTKEQCHSYFLDGCVQGLIEEYSSHPSAKTGISCNGPVSATGPCNSAPVIRYVQRATGNLNCDGVYGPETASYIAKSGKSFKQIAPQCTGAAPGESVYVPEPSPKPAPSPKPEPATSPKPVPYAPVPAGPSEPVEVAQASLLSEVPTAVWVGAAALAGIGVFFILAKKKA